LDKINKTGVYDPGLERVSGWRERKVKNVNEPTYDPISRPLLSRELNHLHERDDDHASDLELGGISPHGSLLRQIPMGGNDSGLTSLSSRKVVAGLREKWTQNSHAQDDNKLFKTV
jgi:hypothetical protein